MKQMRSGVFWTALGTLIALAGLFIVWETRSRSPDLVLYADPVVIQPPPAPTSADSAALSSATRLRRLVLDGIEGAWRIRLVNRGDRVARNIVMNVPFGHMGVKHDTGPLTDAGTIEVGDLFPGQSVAYDVWVLIEPHRFSSAPEATYDEGRAAVRRGVIVSWPWSIIARDPFSTGLVAVMVLLVFLTAVSWLIGKVALPKLTLRDWVNERVKDNDPTVPPTVAETAQVPGRGQETQATALTEAESPPVNEPVHLPPDEDEFISRTQHGVGDRPHDDAH